MEGSVSTLALERFGISESKGFLPEQDPVWTFGEEVHPNLKYLEGLGEQIPELLETHKLRGIVERMKPVNQQVFGHLDKPHLRMAARVYAFLTSAYVHQLDERKVNREINDC